MDTQHDPSSSTAVEVFDIEGMTCAACQARVQAVTNAVDGVESARVNLLKNSMEVSYDGNAQTIEAIVKAVDKAGYSATPRTVAEVFSSHANAGIGGGASAAVLGATVNPAHNAQKAIDHKRMQLIWSMVFSVPLFYVAMSPMFGWPLLFALGSMQGMGVRALLELVLATPILFVNREYFVMGFKSLFHGAPNMDALIALGSAASYAYSLVALFQIMWGYGFGNTQLVMSVAHELYFDSAGMILTLITLGKFFEARAKGKTTNAISALMDLSPKTATLLREGKELVVPTDHVAVGDVVVVRAGQSVPVDGTILEGSGVLDESAITGEPLPVTKQAGEQVVGATVSKGGWFTMRADAVGENTALAGIIRLVDEATNTKAPIQRVADSIAGVFVPIVMVLAALTFAAWLLIFAPGEVAVALNHAVSVLVISCPCALGLATPTAVMVGTGRGAKFGILIKDAEVLETAGALDTVVFDKTGTITEGKPSVVTIVSAQGVSEAELLGYALAIESKSEHPLADAVVAYASKKLEALTGDAVGTGNTADAGGTGNTADADSAAAQVQKLQAAVVENFSQVAGAGLVAYVDGKLVLAGNASHLQAHEVSITELLADADVWMEQGATPLFFSADGRALGMIAVSDAIKVQSASAVKRLHELGLHTIMLTGDQEKTARVVAQAVGVDEVIAGVLPDQKEHAIRELQASGKTVAMVGDGINDAPALARADVGIAIGAGTDIAISSAQVVLMHSNPADVATAIELSRATLTDIHQNLFWALFYNVICIPVAMGVLVPFGITLNPMIGALAMGFSSVFVVSNALRLFGWRPRVAPHAQDDGVSQQVAHTNVHNTSAHGENTDNTSADDKTTDDTNASGEAQEKGNAPMAAKTLTIDGMKCEHCAAHVTEALEGVRGVKNVRVSLDDKTATLDAGLLVSDNKLIKAVEQAGYTVTNIA